MVRFLESQLDGGVDLSKEGTTLAFGMPKILMDVLAGTRRGVLLSAFQLLRCFVLIIAIIEGGNLVKDFLSVRTTASDACQSIPLRFAHFRVVGTYFYPSTTRSHRLEI